MVPIYTRHLRPSEYGILELLNRSQQVVLAIMALGLRITVIRFYFEREDPDVPQAHGGLGHGDAAGPGRWSRWWPRSS